MTPFSKYMWYFVCMVVMYWVIVFVAYSLTDSFLSLRFIAIYTLVIWCLIVLPRLWANRRMLWDEEPPQ